MCSTKSLNSLEEHLSSNIFFISLEISVLPLPEDTFVSGVFINGVSGLNAICANSPLFE